MPSRPLVSIMITTKDRPEELALTLRELTRQNYSPIELVILDDGSQEPIAPIVRSEWGEATIVRHEQALGMCVSRNEGFRLANGELVLQLDDDCSFPAPDAIATAVDEIQAHPAAGAL